MTERLIKWEAGVIWSHEWFATCPTCDSKNTEVIETTHVMDGVQTITRCKTCLYEWKTGIYTDDGDHYDFEEDDDDYDYTEGDIGQDGEI